jgi:hypothetical protein
LERFGAYLGADMCPALMSVPYAEQRRQRKELEATEAVKRF